LKIFLVRHGDADADIPEGLGDEARPLTVRARQQLETHFAALTEQMRGVDAIFTSPLVRAVQTAQILSLVQKHEGILHPHRSLVPEMPVGTMESLVRVHRGRSLVLVGHQPSMGAMAAHLLGIGTFPKPVPPGTVIALRTSDEVEPTTATLLLYAAPGQAVLGSI
jgi:phosphohistidine phosphatase